MNWTEPCRFATAQCVQWLRSTNSDIAYPASTAVDWPHSLLAPLAGVDAHGREVLKARLAGVASRHILVGPVPLCCGGVRAATEQHDLRHRCHTPIRVGRSSRSGLEWALFRLLQGPGRASPRQARAWGYLARSSRPALGSWICLY